MDNPTEQQNLAEFSLVVRQSSLKRFQIVPAGMENWRITPGSMSIADLARHMIRADEWLFRKVADPNIEVIKGNPGEVSVTEREQYDALLARLAETGERRAEFIRSMSEEELAKRIPDGHYSSGRDSTVWWILVRANLDHETHHRGALAVYLRVLQEMKGAIFE